jgi:hypothetical protein
MQLPGAKFDSAPGRISVLGAQTRQAGPLALALFFDPDDLQTAPALRTPEGMNEIVIAKRHLRPGAAVHLRYTVAAAWSGSGAVDLFGYLRAAERESRRWVEVQGYEYRQTPAPDRIEGEAY